MEKSFKKKLLNVNVPIELHNELKKIAINRNCTLTMVVLRFLVEKCIEEKRRYESSESNDSRISDLSDLLSF